jgi:carboxymethylenebutenolidase
VLGIYGGEDPRITDGVPELEAAMKEANKSCEYHVYPGVPHAFFNDVRLNYREDAACDAWRRVLNFFEEPLKTGG